MKYLIIPDVHGRNYNQWYGKIQTVDKVIFLGDYLDSFNISSEKQLEELKKIIALKKKYPNKIILLLGNHELPYINMKVYGTCSGFQQDIYFEANRLYNDNLHLFQICYEHVAEKEGNKNWIFSHAGIQQSLLNTINKYREDYPNLSLCQFINQNWKLIKELTYVSKHNGGLDPYDGLFWIRPSKLLKTLPKEFNQIVGHTFTKFPMIWDTKHSSLMCLDTGHGHIKLIE